MLWVSSNGIWTGTLATGLANYLTSGQAPVAGQWQHVAFSYNGSTARFYVNGTEVANRSFTGNVGDSNTWRIGAYGSTAMGFFDGTIDEVRIYNRALTQTEIEGDMSAPVPRDNQPPTIASVTPASGAAGVSVGATVTARFSEPMDPATITTATIGLATASGTAVPANVTYDPATRTATLTPAAALAFGTQYRVTIEGGPTDPRVKDVAGNALAADTTWTFTTQTSASPILLLTSSTRPFSSYVGEILKAEGLNSYTTLDISRLSISLLNAFSVAVVGEMPLTPTDVATLTSWVNGGGRLITLRPDTQLASLLGITYQGTTLTNGYLLVNTASGPGAGIVGQTIQYHGPADRYTVTGATTVATLYSSATASTTSPAVTIRNVGSNGGQAAAFTYDLARSVVYTRQGNPAWAGQDRDHVEGAAEIMSTDLFFGAAPGDVQPDWVNLDKVAIPQADEQQRLLANMIELMSRDRTPTPRFWYLPRGLKAAVVMTGDDHGHARDRTALRRVQGREPGGLLRRQLDVRPRHLVHVPRHADPERSGGRVQRGRLRARSPSQRRLRLQRPGSRHARRRLHGPAGRLRRGLPEPARAEDVALPLHLLGRLGVAREGRARPRHPHGHELLLLPVRLDGRPPRLVDRLRLPDALRGHRRDEGRRLPAGDPDAGRDDRRPRARTSTRRAGSRRSSTGRSAPRATTASSRRTTTPTTRTTRARRPSSTRRSPAACR